MWHPPRTEDSRLLDLLRPVRFAHARFILYGRGHGAGRVLPRVDNNIMWGARALAGSPKPKTVHFVEEVFKVRASYESFGRWMQAMLGSGYVRKTTVRRPYVATCLPDVSISVYVKSDFPVSSMVVLLNKLSWSCPIGSVASYANNILLSNI